MEREATINDMDKLDKLSRLIDPVAWDGDWGRTLADCQIKEYRQDVARAAALRIMKADSDAEAAVTEHAWREADAEAIERAARAVEVAIGVNRCNEMLYHFDPPEAKKHNEHRLIARAVLATVPDPTAALAWRSRAERAEAENKRLREAATENRKLMVIAADRLELLLPAELPDTDHFCATGYVIRWLREVALAPGAA